MNASSLILILQQFTASHGDAEIKLYQESSVFDDGGFKEDYYESITDVRAVNDWPLPGESLVVANENPAKRIVIFYDSDPRHDLLAQSVRSSHD